jgi:hypothetical protein
MSYYIYKICCDNLPEFVYVGSTKAFRQRKADHKNCCNNDNSKNHNNKLYQTIRENGGWENWRMVLIEECREISFTQARIKEEEHRVKLNANLNMVKCHTTEEEVKERKKQQATKWHENNKERTKEHKNKYFENNKERDKEKITCECGREVSRGGLSHHKKTIFHKNYISNI